MRRFILFLSIFASHLILVAQAAPTRVTDLRVTNTNASSATVSWTTPTPGSGSLLENDVRVSTVSITALNWATRTAVPGEPIPVTPGATQSAIVSGLSPGTVYYFALKVRDGTGWSLVSNVVSATLTVGKSVQLMWTAPDAVMSPSLAGYITCQSKDKVAWNCVDVGKVTTYTFSSLLWGTPDYFRVLAYYDCGPYPNYPCSGFVNSPWSGIASKE